MSKKFKYTNKSKTKQAIIGIGEVEAGETIEVEKKFNNQNFAMVGIEPVTKQVKKVRREK